MSSYEILYPHLVKIMKVRRVLSIFVTLFGFGMSALAFFSQDLSPQLRWGALALAVFIGMAGVFLFASSFKPVERHPLLLDFKNNPKNIEKISRYTIGKGTWCLDFRRFRGRPVKIYGTEAQVEAWLPVIKKDLPHIA